MWQAAAGQRSLHMRSPCLAPGLAQAGHLLETEDMLKIGHLQCCAREAS